MRPFRYFTLGVFLSCLALPPALAERQLLDRVVAVVNDEAITQGELDSLLRPLYEQYKQEYKSEEELMRHLNEARQKLLNQLIEDRLVFQEASKQAIQVDEAEIERGMEEFKKRFASEMALEDTLRKEGLTLSAMRERLKRQTMIRELHTREIRAKVVVSPLEIEEYYRIHPAEFSSQDRVKVRSITVKKSDESRDKGLMDEAAKSEIEDLRKKILDGGDFAKLAQEHSEDVHAAAGGLGDWVEKGQMIPAIDEVIFYREPAKLSEIIETEMGYHLFRVEEKEVGKKRLLDDAREEIFSILFRKKSEKRFLEWMDELKRNAYISIR